MRQAPGIEAFGGGGFRIAGERYEGSVLILGDQVRPWPVVGLAELEPRHFDPVIEAGPAQVEFVLLGLGAAMVPPPRPVRDALRAAGVGLEVMDTVQACKLYNVLAAEGRRVAAALIAV
jgi:uncharacterized protein